MSTISFPKSFKPIQSNDSKEVTYPKSFKPIKESAEITQNETEFPFEGENDLEREIERGQAVATSRILERIIGLPGDIASLLPGSEGRKKPPTSKELQDLSEKYSRGYTKPKTEFEEKAGEFVGDVASGIINPVGVSKFKTVGRLIGIPLAGQLAGQGVEKITGSKKAADYVKFGTMLLTDLWGLRSGKGKGGAKEFGFNSIDKAKKSIKPDEMAKVTGLEKSLFDLEESLKSGITGPHSDESLRAIKEIKDHIKDGQMPANKFPKIREDLNKIIENMQGFKLGGPSKSIRKASVSNLNKVKSQIIKAGNDWGKKHSPEFYKNWKEGNEALSVYYKSKQVGDIVSKFTKIKSFPVRIMLGMEAAHHPLAAIGAGAIKKTAELATKGPVSLAYRFFSSPVLRKLYTGVITEAVKGNAQKAQKLAEKLDKAAEKEKIHQ